MERADRQAEEKTGKRVERTRRALRGALLELMVEHGYEELSVQQILDRSGVGRATFYLHYRGKDDLLRRSLDGLRQHLVTEWRAKAGGRPALELPLGFSLAFFHHVDSHRRLYRAIVGRESGAIVDREMRRLLVDLMCEAGAAQAKVPGKAFSKAARMGAGVGFAAQYVAGALMSIVAWWLDRNIRLSAEELDGLFCKMTLPALKALRNG